MSLLVKRKIFLGLLFTVVCGGVFFVVSQVLAQTTPDLGLAQVGEGLGMPATDIRLIVARIIRVALGLLGIVVLGLILYGGYVWMTAGGNEDNIATAKKILFNAVIGLAIILSAFTIVSFVINQLVGATTGGGDGGEGGGAVNPYGASNVFYIKSKPSGFVCIRNYYPLVEFNHTVNLSTLEGDLIVRRKDNQTAAAGEWQFVFDDINKQNIIKFVPQGDCGTPPNDCLDAAATYELVFKNPSAIKSQAGLILNCQLGVKCDTAEFTTGENVDRQSPKVEITYPNVSSNVFEKGMNVEVKISYWDDNGVQKISLFDNDAFGNIYSIDSAEIFGCQQFGSTTINWPTAAAAMATHTLEAVGFDYSSATGDHEVMVWLRPSHCYNDIQDIKDGETGIDCGGECGLCGGSSCLKNEDCASGWCTDGICVNRMKITNFDPKAGAASTTYVTISGRYFGDNGGHVYFKGIGDSWAEAPVLSCGSGIDNWTQSQIVVSVPPNAVDGPLKVITAPTAQHDSFQDVTDGSDSWGEIFSNFDVNSQKRPGLCYVSPKSGPPYITNVVLNGINFGTTENRVVFGSGSGSFNALIKNWSSQFINVKVPGMAPGTVSVKVIARQNGQDLESNGVAFYVTEETDANTPIIYGITPDHGAKGQYITITGKNFGQNKGVVYFKLDGEGNGIPGDTDFPEACGNDFWNDTQIIIKSPVIEIAKYSVQVQRSSDKAISPIGAYFQAEAGSPGPGICKIDPMSGPVPFVEGKFMTIVGEHLIGALPYFWREIASSSTVTGRLSGSETSWTENETITRPPEAAKTGPVVVYRQSDNKMSNSINFTVFNCLENNNTCTSLENQCCLKGADAGICKPKNEMCEEGTRSTGYMWRFSTRDLPVIPRVVERCDSDSEAANNIPSPSPNIIWNTGGNEDHTNVCRTALVTVAFNTEMDQTTVNNNTVQIFECDSSTIRDGNVCNHVGDPIILDPDSFNLKNNNSQLTDEFYLTLSPDNDGNAWADDIWLQVILSSSIMSSSTALGTMPSSLMRSRPCGDGTAYCFIFKTDAKNCRLKQVAVTPFDYWTSILEEPIKYRKVKDNADDVGTDLWYRGNGLSDQKCIWMNMRDYSWTWSVSSVNYANIYSVGLPPKDNEAQVSALANTVAIGLPNDAVTIKAEASRTISEITEKTSGDSPLHIDLSKPKVIDYWPKCLDACTNAEIGVKFNIAMAEKNFSNALKVWRCLDENCLSTVSVGYLSKSLDSQDRRVIKMSLLTDKRGNKEFATNTVYQVTISKTGTAVTDQNYQLWSSANLIARQLGVKPMQEQFVWRFKTKKDKCLPSRVNIVPVEYIAKYIKDRVIYGAEVYSFPDNCNANGQRLNPWEFDWNWSNSDNKVANIQIFKTKGQNNLCTAGCLKKGSDILWGAQDIEPVCGNNIMEAGEDCDPPAVINNIISCGLDCLRPGNTSTITCGNGGVEPYLGEECDPQDNANTAMGCGQNCLRVGSNKSTGAEEINASICGNGSLGVGEECDLGLTPNRLMTSSSMRCSENCLHLGTVLSAQWCYDNAGNYGGFERLIFEEACANAISQCGDGVVSPNEDCDPGSTAPTNCTVNCLQTMNCVPSNEGCDEMGHLMGSSLLYSSPSVCGDGAVGIGEQAECDEGGFVISHNFTDPWILVTGVGNGPTSGEPSTQLTTITGKELQTPNRISGNAKFIIPCGYHSDLECTKYSQNDYGVAYNTCCYPRPNIISTYPIISQTPIYDVCPNTSIEIKFDKKIDPLTLPGNLFIAQGRTAVDCKTGEENLTAQLTTAVDSEFWYKKIWKKIAGFVINLFTSNTASAIKYTVDSVSWCAGGESFKTEVFYEPADSASFEVTSTVKVYLQKPLATSTDYAIFLSSGIKDIRGVSIGTAIPNWKFITGEKICALKDLSVIPPSYLYQSAGETKDFNVMPISENGQEIQPVDGFRWEYLWQPMFNDYVTLTDTTGALNSITAKNRNGELDVVAITNFTENIFTANSLTLRGSAHLTVFLCENPWPSITALPWKDSNYNFSTYYCRDNGSVGVADDLPNITPTRSGGDDSYMRRYLFTSKDTTDAIGVMIFANLEHLSVEDWFKSKNFKGTFNSLKIDGYSAISDGNNYYIDALNESPNGSIYSNIYLFSINNNAGQEMRRVFEQMITNLKFNNDRMNEKYCGPAFTAESIKYDLPCQSDLDCPLNNFCLNQKDKLQRNYQRLKDLRYTLSALKIYNQNQQIINSSILNFYPLMKESTYLSGQALSVWPAAWTELSTALGITMPIDPINKLGRAGTCLQKPAGLGYTFCSKDEDCATITTVGRVSYWRAEQNTKDEGGVSDGKLNGDVSYAIGQGQSGAFDLSGDSDSKIIIPHKEAYNEGSAFTVSLWIYPRKKNTAVLFKKGGLDDKGNSLGGFMLEYSGESIVGGKKVFNNGTVRFAVYPSSTSQYKYVAIDSNTPLVLNQWHHIAAVYRTNKTFDLYIDNVRVANVKNAEKLNGNMVSYVTTVDLQKNSLDLEIGANFNGLADNVMFYNKNLTVGQIDGLYKGICVIHDSQTGWSAEGRRFSFACNKPLTYAYRYIYNDAGRNFNLKSKMEEDDIDPANWNIFVEDFIGEEGIVNLDNVCRAEEEISSPYSVVCGDGVLGGIEECDPPGKIVWNTNNCPGSNPNDKVAIKKVCASNCEWGTTLTYETCATAINARCGDGKVQSLAGEMCDDGALNGQNGRCNSTCSALVQNCGNYQKENDELCDPTVGRKVGTTVYAGWCVGDPYLFDLFFSSTYQPCNKNADCSTNQCFVSNELYGLKREFSCGWDCKNRGPYCGDGVIQSEWGEQCEADKICSIDGKAGIKKCNLKTCRFDNSQVSGSMSYWNFDNIMAVDNKGIVLDLKELRNGSCKIIGSDKNCPAIVPGLYAGSSAFDFTGGKFVKIDEYKKESLINPQLTIEAWVKPMQIEEKVYFNILEKGGNQVKAGIGLGFYLPSVYKGNMFRCLVFDAEEGIGSVNSEPVSLNQWHHLVCIFNGRTVSSDEYLGDLSIYVDGKLSGRTNLVVMDGTNAPLCFGAKCADNSLGNIVPLSDSPTSKSFVGAVDDVIFYNRVLSEKEITGHYNDKGKYCSAVVEYKEPGACGNGKVEEEEVCDMGVNKNGVVCTPVAPFKSCTYCSADCKNVIIKDVTCGNGVRDVGEICDGNDFGASIVGCSEWNSTPTCNIDCAGWICK